MKYRALVLDLDGTLYCQFPVRAIMALRLAGYYLLRPHRIREVLLLRKYRQLREELYRAECEDFAAQQVREAARSCGIDAEQAERVITSWMIHKPLKVIEIFRRRKLVDAVKKFQQSGGMVVVYSDYPVKEKLEALKLKPDYSYWSNDGFINCMKPNPDGLKKIIAALGLDRAEILYIGDREDKDGMCARNAGVAYIDVRNFREENLS